jgi:uncharacterized protein involved in exopolysaccharide biosynthesis
MSPAHPSIDSRALGAAAEGSSVTGSAGIRTGTVSPLRDENQGRGVLEPREPRLLDLALVLAKHKRLLLGGPLAAALIAMLVALLVPNMYTATARILPPQQQQSAAAALLGQLSGLAAASGGSLALRSQSDVFVAMLKSRTVADNLVQQFDLRRVYGEDTVTDARKRLGGRTEVSNGRDGVIRIDVEDRDPKRAADLANAYVAELENLTLKLTVSEAGQRRLFFEKQLLKAKSDLTEAEVALQRFQEKAGLIAPEAQASMTVSIAANLRAQVTAKEVQLSALRAFATKDNPELVRTEEELATLREQLAKMERDAGKLRGDVLVPVGRAPEVAGEYVQRYRDMKYFETLFQLLAKQYEIARIDEARDAVVVQVLDHAVVPEKKSGPMRSLIVLLTALVTLFVAVPAVFALEAFRSSRARPGVYTKPSALRAQ